MNKQSRWKVSGLLVGVFAFTGCGGLLDVDNPNNLVEDDVQKVQAASAVVNGAEALVWEAVGQIWAPYHVATDDFYWIGSRDAWFSLDQGIVDDPYNEFADAAFPYLGEARWMADYALETIDTHVADGVEGMEILQPRANLYAGIIYMIIAEVQQDFAFSDRQEGQPAVGPANMGQVFDQAISYFDAAVTGFAAASGETADDLGLAALALRARAKQSRAIRAVIQPSPPSSGDPLDGMVADAGATADAQAALDAIGDADWAYQATYSASTVSNSFSFEVNNRQENNIDPAVAVEDEEWAGDGVKYDAVILDPVDGIPDPALQARVDAFRVEGSNYQPADLVTARFLHLIVAEAALASGGDFTGAINDLRALNDDLSAYPGGSDVDMMMHARRVNTWGMGVRMSDMYRWGIQADLWAPTSAAIVSPGTLLPITCIEIRANSNLSGC
ncbi:MAG TPA: hypothetical protein VK858_04885 [Longimicrobiales bacterium]|nr:hypothetical protein [Longimicrobiales bacterium]